jgi:hypothetical protein
MLARTRFKLAINVLFLTCVTTLFYSNCSPDIGENSDASLLAGCRAPSGVSASPKTIAEAIQLINALPKPTTVACFIESLSRPLDFYATFSTSSAQPAAGERSPRIFLFKNNLIISVVPDGAGSEVIEFGEVKELNRSLKIEIPFPVMANINPADPYGRILFSSGFSSTTCGTCHRNEARDTSIVGASAFISDIIRPFSAYQVTLSRVQQELEKCSKNVEPNRCAILNAVLSQGRLREIDFGSPGI